MCSQCLLNTFYSKFSHVCSVKASYYSGRVINHIQKKQKIVMEINILSIELSCGSLSL